MNIKEAVPLNLVGLFVMCMFFHGELAERKPAPRHLTAFYLMVSLGGALGGLAVGLVAVKLFNTYYEFGIGLVFTLLLAAHVTRLMHSAIPMLVLVAVGFSGYHIYQYITSFTNDARFMTRNFYGALRVKDVSTDKGTVRRLTHGVIMHGATPDELSEIMRLTRHAEIALSEAYKPQGINVGMNLGRPAGAGGSARRAPNTRLDAHRPGPSCRPCTTGLSRSRTGRRATLVATGLRH